MLALRTASAWKRALVCLALLWPACTGDSGKDGDSCTVERNRDGAAVIRCADGTEVLVDRGVDGTSCSVENSDGGGKLIRCADGTTVNIEDGKNGELGERGAIGATGAPGSDGDQGERGFPGLDGDKGDNGMDGRDGADGTSQTIAGPGLAVEIVDVTIPSDRRPVVQLRLRDAQGRALDRLGTFTDGAVTVKFVIAYLPADGAQYVPYDVIAVEGQEINSVAPALSSASQPQADVNGTWTTIDIAQGSYEYRLASALPSGYDTSKTHTVAALAARTYEDVRHVANASFSFRPDQSSAIASRDVVSEAACNGCHASLSAHDGTVTSLTACVMCHTAGMADPESGNSLDFRQMVHKIHRGDALPTKPYALVGDGGTTHDYSTVGFPRPTENCAACHRDAAHSGSFQTAFSRDACGSCHDDIYFGPLADKPVGMTAHTGNEQTTDQFCYLCHEVGAPPTPGGLLTAIDEVHRPLRGYNVQDPNDASKKLAPPVLTGSIVAIGSVSSGTDLPVVTFSIAVNGSAIGSIDELDRLAFTFAGPTTDYVGYAHYAAFGDGAVGTVDPTGTPGEFTWTSASTLQEIADSPTLGDPARPAIPLTGSWAVGMQARVLRNVVKPDTTVVPNITFDMHNDVGYFAISDVVPQPRREVVNADSCNTCHEDLAAHGGASNDPELCVLCHGANNDSSDVPLPAAGSTASTSSLRASHMVHRIHTGAAGTRPFQIGAEDFGTTRFPGDRARCTACHVNDTEQLPLQSGLLSSFGQSVDDTGARLDTTEHHVGPTAAACTGCHDEVSTAVHTETMSTASTNDPAIVLEACATCHADGSAFGGDLAHRRR